MQLAKYILKRVLLMLLALFIVISLTFFMMQFMPGSPFHNPHISQQQLKSMEAAYGLNKPLWQQYLIYLGNMITGNFGTSFTYQNQPVSMMIAQRLPVSSALGLQAMIIGTILGVLMGVSSARHKNGVLDAVWSFLSTLAISIPSFVIGAIALIYLGYTWNIFPIIGWDGMFSATSWLPSISLAMIVVGTVARFVRSEMVESLTSDYILLARAKGLSEREVVYHHAFRNSIIPALTLIGPMAANLLTGSILIEQMFSIPGIGQQFVTSITAKDYPVIMATTIVYAVMLMLFILITDVITALVDPRIRLQ
jgi:oligopeptide transport system permease protein